MYFKYSRKTGQDYIRFLLDEQFTPHKVYNKAAQEVDLQQIPEEQRSDADSEDSGNENDDIVEQPTVAVSAQLPPTEIRDFVNSLKESAVHWFNSFYLGRERDETQWTEEEQWIDRLNRIGMAYFRPLVMAVLKNERDATRRIQVFKCIERFIFVVFRLASRKANYSDSVFYNLARELDQHRCETSAIERRLEQYLGFAFNNDGNLRADYFYDVLHDKFKSGVGYYGWSGLRYFLYEYELNLLSVSRQKKFGWNDLLKTQKDKISIEHIYP